MLRSLLLSVVLIGCATLRGSEAPPTSPRDGHENVYVDGRLPGVKGRVASLLTGTGTEMFGSGSTTSSPTFGYVMTTGAVPGLSGAADSYLGSYDSSHTALWLLNNGTAPSATNYAVIADSSILFLGGSGADYKVVTSNAASGQNAFAVATNGARIDFGSGASDYASSDGTTVTYAGPIASASNATMTGFVWAKAGYFNNASGALWVSQTAPTISSGFGTSPSVSVSNGTAAFQINVGTGGVATSGVIGMPAATTGWRCDCDDLAGGVSTRETRQTGTSTTSCTISSVNTTTGVAIAWPASEVLTCDAVGF